MPMMITPTMAAMPYSGLTPRIGIEMTSPSQNRMFSTTADPIPAVASANPASGPVTPDSVSSRYPSADPAALPPGTMFDSALVLSWIRKMRACERPAAGRAERRSCEERIAGERR